MATNFYQDRKQAGELLGHYLSVLGQENSAVIALSEGGVLVGAEIAKRLHSSLFIFASQKVDGSQEDASTALGSRGVFSYNTSYSFGQFEEDVENYRMYTDQRSMNEFQSLNRIAGRDGTIPKLMLKRHNVILVSDGLNSALSLEIAAHFLHAIDIKKLIIATPIASMEAVNKMHSLVDQIFCMRSVESFVSVNHYYEKNDIPDDKTVVDIMQNNVFKWSNEEPQTAANN